MPTLAEKISAWMGAEVRAASAGGLVVGLSGGVDSAVVARLSQLAMSEATLGVLLPCHSDPRDEQDAALVASHFALPTIRIDLALAYDAFVHAIQAAAQQVPPLLADGAPVADDIRGRVPLANVKPRLRMASLYFVANRLNCLVAGTGNRSELEIGYFTKYGDGGVDLLPLGSLLKSQVRVLARDLGVPPAIVEKAPSAGLWLGQTDEDEMGFTYAELERYQTGRRDGVTPGVADKVERLIRASHHKRALPPIFTDV